MVDIIYLFDGGPTFDTILKNIMYNNSIDKKLPKIKYEYIPNHILLQKYDELAKAINDIDNYTPYFKTQDIILCGYKFRLRIYIKFHWKTIKYYCVARNNDIAVMTDDYTCISVAIYMGLHQYIIKLIQFLKNQSDKIKDNSE
jgi:hypothetical protein